MERNTSTLLGFDIDTFTFGESLNYAKKLFDSSKSSHIVTINPEIIETANKQPEIAKILQEAELVIPDGIGIKIGLKIKGVNVQRIAGIEFAKKLLEEASKEGIPVAFTGAKHQVLEKACENLKTEMPNLNIVYTQDGYFQDKDRVFEELKQKSPKLLLVALGAPRQEEFIYELKSILPSTLMIGVGGSFDVWAGEVQRAPVIYQKMGLEWFYRTVKQPERFKRIFPTLPVFVYNVIKETFMKKEV